MIDIHNHILPGIDDGARDLGESVAMARVAVAEGIRVIVATPHHYPNVGGTPREHGDRLRASILQAAEVALDLRLGEEITADPAVPDHLAKGQVLPIEDTRYVLIEPPFFSYPPWVDELFFRLQLLGFRPIIAHPERNSEIQRDPAILARLVERGILSQITAGSLLGHFGAEVRKVTETLLERNLAHVLATDAHAAEGPRAPLLTQAVEVASKHLGPERAEALVTMVPQAILEGREVAVEPVREPPARLFRLFRS